MDASWIQLNRLELRAEDIQYLPEHRCPQCGASPKTTENGSWLRSYQDWYGTPLSGWLDHLGYVYFQCDCQHHPQFMGALRVARLGDAILPIAFDDGSLARQLGLHPALVNADRVRQAVTFLAKHADPDRTIGTDWLAHTIHALAAGGISPEAARQMLDEWLAEQISLHLAQAQASLQAPALAEVEVGA